MSIEFRADLPGPLDIHGSLELFRRSGDDLIDRWDGQRLIRAVPAASGHAWIPFAATPRGNLAAPSFDVVVEHASDVEVVRRAVATTFFAAPRGYADLLRRDPVVAELDARSPGIRQIRQLDLFTALVRCISAQQVNLRWAVTTRRRLAETFGRRHEIAGELVYGLDPIAIAEAPASSIRALQFTMSKSVSLVAAARAMADPELTLERLEQATDSEVIARLITVRGIGRWSAEWVLSRTLGRPSVVAGDLGVRKAVGLAYRGPDARVPTEQEVRDITAHWGESAGVAQAVLLHALGEGILTAKPARPESPAASRA